MTLVAPFDAAAPPQDTWGPMLVVALVVVAAVAMILGFGRITRGGRTEGRGSGQGPGAATGGQRDEAHGTGGSSPQATASDDELPTDPV
ncbi:MAG: hypothetical protein HOQ18_13225 [Dermatophilaceae bacterium]|nr:hypothetical protein [Dermatophilaceae bacterium]